MMPFIPDSIENEAILMSTSQPRDAIAQLIKIQSLLLSQTAWPEAMATVLAWVGKALDARQLFWYAPGEVAAIIKTLYLSQIWRASQPSNVEDAIETAVSSAVPQAVVLPEAMIRCPLWMQPEPIPLPCPAAWPGRARPGYLLPLNHPQHPERVYGAIVLDCDRPLDATALTLLTGVRQALLLKATQTQTNVALQQAERERDRFFMISADLFCIADFAGYFKRLNFAWANLLGYELDELFNQPYLDFVHPDDRASTNAQAQVLHQGAECTSFVNRYRCADGSYRWLEWNAVAYHQEKQIYAVARDITAQTELELARQASRQRLEAAQRVAHVGDWDVNLITGQTTWSQELFRIFGIEPQDENNNELLSTDVHSSATIFQEQYLQQIHPDDRSAAQRALQQAIITTEPYEVDYRVIRPDGEIRHVYVRGQPVLSDYDQVIRVFGTTIDVTELKQAKLELQTQLAREQLVAQIFAQFMQLKPTELDQGIQNAIARLGQFLKLEHCYVLQRSGNALNCIQEWCVNPTLNFCECSPERSVQELLLQNAQGEWLILNVPNVNHIPPELEHLQDSWQANQITATLKVPLVVREQLIGCLACNMVTGPRQWNTDEIVLVRLVGEIVAGELERRTATLALKESEERFRQLAENINSVFWLRDVQLQRLLYTSPAYEKIWGRSREELLRVDFKILSTIHVEDRAHMQALFRQMDTKEYNTEYRIVRPDGQVRWIHDRAFPIRNASGQIYRVIGVAEDISDRKRTEQALQVLIEQTAAQIGQEFFQALIQELAKVLEIQYAFVTRCLDDPPTRAETLAFWMGNDFGENFTYDLKDTPCGNVFTDRELCFYPQRVQQSFPNDQDLVMLGVESYAAIPLVDSNQQVLGHLAIMDARPLTDLQLPRLILQLFAARAGAELERLRNEEELRQSEERLQLALQSSNLGLWDWHLPSNTSYLSSQWKRLLGYEPDELANDYYHEWHSRVHPEDLEPTLALLQKHLHGDASEYQAEFRMCHRSGEWVWILAHGKVFERDDHNNPVRITGTHQDITERKAIERMKDEFVSVISHELRTPLTSIHGAVKLLETGKLGAFNAQGQQMLTIAANNTTRLSRLINDILDLQRLESGQFSLNLQACRVVDLFNQSSQNLAAIATSDQIQIDTLTTDPQLQVWADPDYLMQVLTNLLSNALKFSPPQSTITLQASGQEQQVCVQVRDRGRGIPADKLDTIFERFHQVDASDSRQKGGTGLGLAICKHIVQQHGGHIWVESVVNEGSTFYFTCPLVPDREPLSLKQPLIDTANLQTHD
ncbi:MAG: PAS domain-containing protein [Cyanobacteria bacterium P01_G01_bin.54]